MMRWFQFMPHSGLLLRLKQPFPNSLESFQDINILEYSWFLLSSEIPRFMMACWCAYDYVLDEDFGDKETRMILCTLCWFREKRSTRVPVVWRSLAMVFSIAFNVNSNVDHHAESCTLHKQSSRVCWAPIHMQWRRDCRPLGPSPACHGNVCKYEKSWKKAILKCWGEKLLIQFSSVVA